MTCGNHYGTLLNLRAHEEFTAAHRKKSIARYASMDNKQARKEVARKLKQPGLYEENFNDKEVIN
jgi:valyl-tRNA synthetase